MAANWPDVIPASVAVFSAALLGCAPGPPAIRSSAWFPSNDSNASRRPLDCSNLQPPAPAGTIGDPVEPGRGRELHEPADLGVGPVRLVWTSTVSGIRLDWVAPAVPEARRLWLLRVGDSGRCVVGVWSSAQLGFQVIRHVFRNDQTLELVLLGHAASLPSALSEHVTHRRLVDAALAQPGGHGAAAPQQFQQHTGVDGRLAELTEDRLAEPDGHGLAGSVMFAALGSSPEFRFRSSRSTAAARSSGRTDDRAPP